MRMQRFRRVITLGLFLAAVPLAAQTPPYDRTVIVGGSAAPAVNGTNLINALAAIPSPGPANRWLVKVEPGQFDLGTQALALRDYVDIEGSGRGVTVITSAILQSSPWGATVVAAPGVHAEARELTVRNTAPDNFGTGVFVLSNTVRLTRIDVELDTVNGGTGLALDSCTAELVEVSARLKASSVFGRMVGVFAVGGGPRLVDILVTADVPDSGLVRGVVLQDAAATVDQLTVKAPVATPINQQGTGIEIVRTGGGAGPANQPSISNARLTVGGPQSYGILVTGGAQPEIRDTVATVSVAYFATGMSVRTGSHVKLYGSRLRGDGGAVFGLGIHLDGSTSSAEVHHSTVEGTTGAYLTNGGTLSFGASQLLGPRPGGATCTSSYNGAFAPLNGPC
jgi:hypothetical protein